MKLRLAVVAVLSSMLIGCAAREPITKIGVVFGYDPGARVRYVALCDSRSKWPILVVYARGMNGWGSDDKPWFVRWPFHKLVFGEE